MKDMNMMLAGFGGQGILFAGKVIAYAGLADGREVSWLPSYGPEMRGGTTNCSVCVSEEPIGLPLVISPDVLMVMNQPSLDMFIDKVVPGGLVLVDSSMAKTAAARSDVDIIYIPATELAEKNGLRGLANIIMTGRFFKETAFCSAQALEKGILKSVPASKPQMIEFNMKALEIGKAL